ncbi:MAG: DUF1549 domain-containing protein [Candidatus Omnitrophica bacterium]|nr:DUF1549 domain-containing protein [Candidatus Omnitrophota bacterium]
MTRRPLSVFVGIALLAPLSALGEPRDEILDSIRGTLDQIARDPKLLEDTLATLDSQLNRTRADLEALEQEIGRVRTQLDSALREQGALLAKQSHTEAASAAGETEIVFGRDIRPILSQNCFTCHGPDEKQRKAGLRLDQADSARSKLKSGLVAIQPGNREGSELYRRITCTDPDEVMPPKDSHKSLTPGQIELLGRWIDAGAVYTGHWAFEPLNHPAPPTLTNTKWRRNEIDAFILAAMESKGIEPNPEADRRTLIRRLSFDLLGLPPSREEVDQFVSDSSPDAYERLVDRLLESPHFGERWARHWLDLARFAESHGYEQDYDRKFAYHYRDFVIQAFNQDLPYDTFVKWQLAGDELSPDNPLALKATGFLAAGVHSTQITKNQAEKERYDELDDMSRTMGVAMLGLTIGCARCHDHKYDPITTTDYYRLLSTFTTTVRSEIDVPVEEEVYKQERARWEKEHTPLLEDLAKFESEELPSRFEEWLKSNPTPTPPVKWEVLEPTSYRAEGGASLLALGDGSFLAYGSNSEQYSFVIPSKLEGITAIKIEALRHDSLPRQGPGRGRNGEFALSDLHVTLESLTGAEDPIELTLVGPKATSARDGNPVSNAVDMDRHSAWTIPGGTDTTSVFEIETPVSFETHVVIRIKLSFAPAASMGRIRLSATTSKPPIDLDSDKVPDEVRSILAEHSVNATSELSSSQRESVLAWYKTTDGRWQDLTKRIRDHLRVEPKPDGVKVLVASEGVPPVRNHTQGVDFYRETYFLTRGDPKQKQGVANQGFLTLLTKAPEKEKRWQVPPPEGWRTSYRRSALANWITDVDFGAGHLLARVIVNRLWQHHMGRGIVGTPSDFGYQGDWPTHPELLDWLASELIRGGWKLKPIHRLILNSAAYRQSSDHDEVKARIDRERKLFWGHPRRRLEGEIIRDSMLAVSGLLDPRMHGPGTLDPNHHRRSIYFTIKRSRLVPMMTLFDCPDSVQSIAARPITTIAPQALMLLNNSSIRDYAVEFAKRVAPKDGDGMEGAVRAAYRLAIARDPSEEELRDTLRFVEDQAASYGKDGKSMEEARSLALADFCQVVLNLNEFVYVN